MKNLFSSLFLSILIFSGCSFLNKPSDPEVYKTVIRVSAMYLNSIGTGEADKALDMLDKSVYFKNGRNQRSVVAQIISLKNKNLESTENPFYSLVVVDAIIEDDEAEVEYRKKDYDDERINISLSWSGTGWRVKDDNVFGDSGYLNNFFKPKK